MTSHEHHHQLHGSELSEIEIRVRALETVLTEKGYVDPSVLDPRHWLAALERLVAEKGIATMDTLACYRHAWDHAAHRTPHGKPITLSPEDFEASSVEPPAVCPLTPGAGRRESAPR